MSQRTKVVGTRTPMMWLLVVLAVILIAALAVGAFVVLPQQQQRVAARERAAQAEQHYQAGIALEGVDDWPAAEAEYKQVIASAAGYKDTKARLAEVKSRQAEMQTTATAVAVAEAVQAQAAASSTAQAGQATAVAAPTITAEALEARYQRALGLINMQQWVEAQAELRSVFDIDPDYRNVQEDLSIVNAEVAKLTPTTEPTPIATSTPSPTPTARDTVIYSNDFDTSAGSEWSDRSIDTTPGGRRFLGRYGNEAVTLRINELPSHTTATISFDLFIIQTWDGNQVGSSSDPSDIVGPDEWSLNVTELARQC